MSKRTATPNTMHVPAESSGLESFHPAVQTWFSESFTSPTLAQRKAWPAIADGLNTLLLAPTGSGKTLSAFLVAIDRLMFTAEDDRPKDGVRVLYISPLKALGVDVERNLRAPISGVRAVSDREGYAYHTPSVGVRSGDTDATERVRLRREPPDILITTPESLYLMLTSRARDSLRSVETVIIDEIHSLAGTKRGTHLFLSLERLETWRHQHEAARPLQRIGLSATQRPLEEIARLLGGAAWTDAERTQLNPRPVQVIEARDSKSIDVRIEVPIEDMSDLASAVHEPHAAGSGLPSIWPSIHPRLVELIRQHRSTMIFVNSRRLAERLANAINELADEELALAHHGSIAKAARLAIEDRLKRGQLPAIVATSSLELGIDMGAVDLVIQVASPPTIAAGIQRIGRAGHQVGVCSNGIVFPKYRGDLLACSAATARMLRGEVEETYFPRNPLDVLAQQLVAMVALEPVDVDDLYATVRQAAPYHDLPRTSFEGVLNLLAGKYPSDEFAELRPRVNWDRIHNRIEPRRGSQRLAISNAGTIPDRGLYGVFLLGDESRSSRVGELDEEMVFEIHAGDVFQLGASSWRVAEITHDRVLVTPAPGEPGRMPFWRGDGPGRPLEFGRAIGRLSRELGRQSVAKSQQQLIESHGLDQQAATNLLQYIQDQVTATGEVPSDRTVLVECFLDEVGDWRICVLTPFGARIHAPWAAAVAATLRQTTQGEVDMMWSDDGMVFRLPEATELPGNELLFPDADEIESLVVRELGSTAMFAARFRENAARALLLPKRQPGRRTPLWLQRRRSADLLAVAANYPDFPIMLETYRECLRDVFDLKGLRSILQDIQRQTIRVHRVETQSASPFASSLMFNYTANFLYDGDTPLAERRAQTLSLDHAQLCELLGDAEMRELLSIDAVEQVQLELQRLDARYSWKDQDDVADLLRCLGDLSRDEIMARRPTQQRLDVSQIDGWIKDLVANRRVIAVRIAGEERFVSADDAGRLRDALGIVPPPGLPDEYLAVSEQPLEELLARYARTHVPFRAEDAAARFGLGMAPVRMALERLLAAGRLFEGEFLPGGRGREWCDPAVLRQLKQRSLALLRKQIEPVEQTSLVPFLASWQGLTRKRRGLDGLLDVIEQLQGVAIPASVWEDEILSQRVDGYRPSDLDELCSAGEVVWRGVDSLGSDDGRIAFYLADDAPLLAPMPSAAEHELAEEIRECLRQRGAMFFDDLVTSTAAFSHDVFDAIWSLVWSGHVTNDTLVPLRSRRRQSRPRQHDRTRPRRTSHRFRSRRTSVRPGSEGRWSLFGGTRQHESTSTEQQVATANQLMARYGVLTREMVTAEGIRGGFAGLYPVLKAMEEAGKLRRGYFVAGMGAAQFALPGADDQLRRSAHDASTGERHADAIIIAATDPANPYGGALRWPETSDASLRPQRTAGAKVVFWKGRLVAYLNRSGQHLLTFPSMLGDVAAEWAAAMPHTLAEFASRETLLLSRIDGLAARDSEWARPFQQAGFILISKGLLRRADHTTEEVSRNA